MSGHLIVFPYTPFVLTCYCSNYGHSFCLYTIVVHPIVLCRTIGLTCISSVPCTHWSTSSLLITGVPDIHTQLLLDSLTVLLHSPLLYVSITTLVLFIMPDIISLWACDGCAEVPAGVERQADAVECG